METPIEIRVQGPDKDTRKTEIEIEDRNTAMGTYTIKGCKANSSSRFCSHGVDDPVVFQDLLTQIPSWHLDITVFLASADAAIRRAEAERRHDLASISREKG